MTASSPPAAAGERRPSSRAVYGALALILAASLVPRLPVLYNAVADFNSDEAVNALVVRHLLAGEPALYNWDATYYGIVEGLLALPFVAVLGSTAAAFKLGSLVGFLGLVAFVFLLGRRLYGPWQGIAAAALLVAFSPEVIGWSARASGGYALVLAWGTATLLYLDGLARRPTSARIAGLGFLVGFGLYIYEMYLLYAAVVALWALPHTSLWRALRAPSREARREALARMGGDLRAAGLFLVGLAAGWAPKIAVLLAGGTGSKKPFYTLVGLEKIGQNLRLLLCQCVPAFFGVNPADSPELHSFVGPHWLLSRTTGKLVLVAYAAAWLWGLWSARKEIAGVLARPPVPAGVRTLLVLLVPVTALLFVLSPNPQDTGSNRYLLPWLTSLPVLAGAFALRLERRFPPAGAALLVFLAGFPLVQSALALEQRGFLDGRLRLRRVPEPLVEVLGELRRQGVPGGYATYWPAYKATFLSGERILFTAFRSWDRHPAYTRRVDRMGNVAYLFAAGADAEQIEIFRRQLRTAGRPFSEREIGGLVLFTSPERRRLLPPALEESPRPLARPRAEVVPLAPPALAAPGETLALRVRVTNRSDAFWSAAGVGPGYLRVSLCYRWLTREGQTVTTEGTRSPLPRDLRPGESAELTVWAPVPAAPGSYLLQITPIQEGVAWFADVGGGDARLPVEVREAGAGERRAAG